MADIFAIHHLVAAEVPALCPNQDDVLREIVRELGSVKSNENELMAVSTSEINLTLNPKLHGVEGRSGIIVIFMQRMLTTLTRSRCGGESSLHGD